MTSIDGRSQPAVSVVGTGALGSALAHALLRGGRRVTVWNRTAEKADPLVAAGAARAATPGAAVGASEIVVVCVSTYDDVHAVLHPVAGTLAGRTLVNLTSGTPAQARAMAAWAVEHGVGYLDGAAMSGTRLVGGPEALFLYSGAPEVFADAEPALSNLGRPAHLGADPGVASVYDIALLTLNLGVLAGFYHAVALVGRAGAEAPHFASIATDYLPFVTGLLTDHAHQIHEQRYPGDDGTLDVLAGAIDHVIETSRDQSIRLEVPAAIKALVERAVAAGHGRDGIARLAQVVATP